MWKDNFSVLCGRRPSTDRTAGYRDKGNHRSGGVDTLDTSDPRLSPSGSIHPCRRGLGFILSIGDWVLREACAQARAWEHAGLPAITMAVNVSLLQFRTANLLEDVCSALIETGLDPRYLELELTESAVMTRAGSTASVLSTLRGMGERVAADDFGTGYCSLSYIRKFLLDTLKIEQSLIRQITTIPDEKPGRSLDGMHRAKYLRHEFPILRATLQLGPTELHPLQPFLALRDKLVGQIFHFSLIGTRSSNHECGCGSYQRGVWNNASEGVGFRPICQCAV